MTAKKNQRGDNVWPVMGSRPLRVVRRDLSVQTDQRDGKNFPGDKGEDKDVRCNMEGEYD
jgi:hypothetical protein